MLSKTVIAAAAFATAVAAYDLPACWTSCFEKYEVDSEGCLCKDALGTVVSSCISQGCSASNATAYSSWLASYCNEAPVSSNTWAVPSSTYSIVSSEITTIPAYTTSAETSAWTSAETTGWTSAAGSSPSAYTSAAWTTPVASSAGASYSVCTESTTLIWRSSTAVVPTVITHTPGGSWGSSVAAANATATGGSWPSVAPATGGAARVGAGLAVIGGAVAAVLL